MKTSICKQSEHLATVYVYTDKNFTMHDYIGRICVCSWSVWEIFGGKSVHIIEKIPRESKSSHVSVFVLNITKQLNVVFTWQMILHNFCGEKHIYKMLYQYVYLQLTE